jgi:hypothetical protein
MKAELKESPQEIKQQVLEVVTALHQIEIAESLHEAYLEDLTLEERNKITMTGWS